VSVGWQGPWGTTYALNLRLFVNNLSEEAWTQLAHAMRANPPMPFWTLNAMTKQDLRAIYQYVKSLGPGGRRHAGQPPARSRANNALHPVCPTESKVIRGRTARADARKLMESGKSVASLLRYANRTHWRWARAPRLVQTEVNDANGLQSRPYPGFRRVPAPS
jgi:hypothetical protein